MAKLKVITRAANLLRDAEEIEIGKGGKLIPASIPPAPGWYRVIPVEDADAMVGALQREDARSRVDPSLRKRRKVAKRKVAR